jgi:outer membrane protein
VAEKEANARQLEQTKQRFDVGLVAITDVHESRAAYDFSVAEAIAAENNLDSARESLREITGDFHENLKSLDENMPLLPPEPADLQDWTRLAMDQNAALKAAYEDTVQAEEYVSSQTSSNYPKLDLVLNHTKYEGSSVVNGVTVNSDSDNSTASLQLSWSLFEGGGTQSRITQAREWLRASRQYLEQSKRATQASVRNSYRGVLSGISRVNALKQAVVSNKSALRAAEAGYEVGTRTTVDVLDARRNLFRAQRDYAKARYDYLIETLNLDLAAGTLTSEHLNSIGKWMH